MDDQKIENLLNLSLEATPEERERSLVLEEGYRPDQRLWELIVKYSGDFGRAAALARRVSYLLNEYAIVWIEEDRIQDFAGLPEVEYIEKPKRLFFADQQARAASCLLPVQREPLSLFGTGVLVAVIDSGADIFNRDFRNADGTTRIRALWDQTAPDAPEESDPQPFGEEKLAPVSLGRVYGAAQINEFLQRAAGRADGFVPGEDRSGHGTAVLGIAAGNGANSDGRNRGVAPESQLLVVKLGTPDPEGFPRTTQLIQGVDFAVRQALLWKMPVAVNVSFGNSYGPHDGTSLTERFLDDLSNYWKSVLVIGSGNEGAAGGHTGFTAVTGGRENVRLAVGSYEPGLNVQIWKQYVDDLSVVLVHPSGTEYQVPVNASGAHRVRLGGTELLLYVGEPGPYSTDQELFFDFLPLTDYVDPGEWRFDFTGNRVVSGNVNLWLPGGNVLGRATRFLEPAARLTLTIPSTAERVITAGAYDSRRDTLADFSGRGSFSLGKPDLAAPGVDIAAPTPGNGYGLFSGTSMAAPFVTGSAALLMEWGILRGNDPYLYGEKVKAYLQKGARQLPFAEEYPNPQVGYGALCVADSLPV